MTGQRPILFGGAALASGFLVLFVSGGSRQAMGLVLKPMAESFGWERGALGAAVALFLVVSAVGMFVAGSLADRFSLRAILGGGIAFCAVGIGGMSLVAEPWHALLLYGLIFGIGAGAASVTPVGVMVTRRYPGRAGLANAAAIAGMGLGQLAIIAALAVILAGEGWQPVFLALGALNLVVALLIFRFLREGIHLGSAQHLGAGTPFGKVLAQPYFWLLVAVYALCGFQDFFVATHVVAFALDQGLGALLSGNLLAFMGLAGLLGVLASGAWSDKSGPIPPAIACFALRAALFVLILSTKDPGAVASFALLYGVTFWVTAPLTVIFVRDAFGVRHLGALSGFVTMIHHICGGLGAWMGAAHFDADGDYDLTFAIMAGCSLAGILLTALMGRRQALELGKP